jgi:hypothetical protein
MNHEDEFASWLTKHKLQSYQQALEDQGYDDLHALSLLSEEEIQELSTAVNMKPGEDSLQDPPNT